MSLPHKNRKLVGFRIWATVSGACLTISALLDEIL